MEGENIEESNEKKDNLINDKKISINSKKRMILFIVLVIIATFSSCDGGIIPQQNIEITEDFEAEGEKEVGLFGSIDYIGRVVSAIIMAIIMGRMNRKIILVSTLFFKAFTLIIPLLTVNYYVNTLFRCLSGLSQVFYPTYFPVWCDQYGKKSSRAMMVTLVQLGNPIGIIVGYGISLFFSNLELFGISAWRTSFALEGIILAACGLIIIFLFEDIYFSEKFILIEDTEGKLVEKKEQKSSFFSNLTQIICNKIFLFSSICNSIAFFGIGVVQFFADKYMNLVLDINESVRFVLFALICLFGPTTGMVFGGFICHKLGGYVKKKAMIFVIILMTVASVFSMLISCHKITALFVLFNWTYLFAIGGTIPPISGIIISCLDNQLRGDGFSITNCITNALGSFPSSYIFSILVDAFDSNDGSTDKYRYAWMISMGYNFLGLIFVVMAGIFRFRIKGDLSDNVSKEDNEDEGNIDDKDEEKKKEDKGDKKEDKEDDEEEKKNNDKENKKDDDKDNKIDDEDDKVDDKDDKKDDKEVKNDDVEEENKDNEKLYSE